MNIFSNLWRKSKLGHPSSQSANDPGLAAKEKPYKSFLQNMGRVFLLVAGLGIVFGIYSLNILYRRSHATVADFVLGQKNHSDIYAQVPFAYVDLPETVEKRRHAIQQVLDIYQINESKNAETLQNFNDLFDLIEITTGNSHFVSDRYTSAATLLYRTLSAEQLNILISWFNSVDKKDFFLQTLAQLLASGVIDRNSDEINSESISMIALMDSHQRIQKILISSLPAPPQLAAKLLSIFSGKFPYVNAVGMRDISPAIIASLILPNIELNQELTKLERKQVGDEILPVRKWVTKGTVFLPRGKTIIETDLSMLESHENALQADTNSGEYIARIANLEIVGLFTILMGFLFICQQHPFLLRQRSLIVLIALTIAGNIILNRAVEEIAIGLFGSPQIFIYPALPMAFTAVFLTILLGAEIGLSVGIFSVLLYALPSVNPMHLFLLGIFTSIIGTLSTNEARTRTQTTQGVIFIALTIVLMEGSHLVFKATPWSNYILLLGIAAANGLITIIIVNLLLPLAEAVFGLTSKISLLELSDLNHPLLKRLQFEAPGTYHHTLMVATISEHAAEVIGANALFTRVACYFHDIGKLANPSYFTENCFGINRHEDLSPRMSSLIILNHVKEGLALAAKYKLKRPIREVIAAHHGTSLVLYFYRQAIQDKNDSGDSAAIDEKDFRYSGPLPKNKETSIISLADACEAASRSLQQPTSDKIRKLIDDIFNMKISDGQLQESELTMAEINQVKEAVISTLVNVYHARIAYPKITDNENHREKSSAQIPAGQSRQTEGDDAADADIEQAEATITNKG